VLNREINVIISHGMMLNDYGIMDISAITTLWVHVKDQDVE
jgi:hypothetical protein